jgi:diacylglycerol O-acyltransferase
VNYVPISIAINGMGLNVTGFSYAGDLWICAVSCREMLPDPAFFADCLRSAFDQMKEAAAREAAFVAADVQASEDREDVDAIDGEVVRVVPKPRKRKPAKAAAKPVTSKRRPRKVARTARRSRTAGAPADANA